MKKLYAIDRINHGFSSENELVSRIVIGGGTIDWIAGRKRIFLMGKKDGSE